ncbi:DUF417 family protein [Gallaecimonas xiamenensis]|uniref:Uncharacterized protein n=1 Tax=Gallaecimonas xiamenensis 3-C-1 TaxID=745411 RepID=K2JB29_9GAMM|nr:DUF417 family protein [Gallaecimonas xiamenensis]EKE72343.1 hypothetical protein B3C1_10942 [Gallaecimonas xiamenensis 3-C-1]
MMTLTLRALLVLFLGWQGLSTLMSKAMNLSFWLTQGPVAIPTWVAMGWGGLQLLLALWLLTPRYKQALWPVLLMLALPLLGMFTYPVWIQSLGGFPAIGAGQSIIKEVALCALPLWLLGYRRLAGWLAVLGLALVFGWIGAMKFTAVEAQGVAKMMQSSPFTAWPYKSLSVQGVSYAIGVIELVLLAIFLTPRGRRPGTWGLWATFAVTLHFFFFYDAALMHCWLTSSGTFLLKDALLAGAAWIALTHGPRASVS